MLFAVGFKLQNRANHVIIDADDALTAALEVQREIPDAKFNYVRPRNKRGDARHPVLKVGHAN